MCEGGGHEQGGQDVEHGDKDRDINTVKDTFVTVKEGKEKMMPTVYDAKGEESKKSGNTYSFPILDLDEDKEEDETQEIGDDDKTTDDEVTSVNLFYPPTTNPGAGVATKKSILQLLHDNLIKKINLMQQPEKNRRNQRNWSQFQRFLKSQTRNSANMPTAWSTLRTRFNANVKMMSQFRIWLGISLQQSHVSNI